MAAVFTIRKRLLIGLITVVALLWGVVVLFVYRAAQYEVEEVFDAALVQEARVLSTLLIHEAEEETERREILSRLVQELGEEAVSRSPLLVELIKEYGKESDAEDGDYLTLLSREQTPGHRYESKIAFLVSYGDNRPMLRSPNAPSFRIDESGFYDLDDSGKSWRVFGLDLQEQGLWVQVGERMAVRQETVEYILINSLWPMFLSLPILGLVIWLSVGKGLRPLNRVAETVEQRAPTSLQPLATDDVPGEVVPIVDSLNRLFHRVQQALENERRFTANAAHELRTPLAALKTQAQVKQLDDNNGEHAEFLDDIINGVDRTTHLLEQLLTLARADALQKETILQQQVDLHAVATGVLAMIGERALEKRVELSMESPGSPLKVYGDEATLGILIRNLVDNGIRYTPPDGAVTVQLLQNDNAVHLVVEDSGPGIPKPQREKLFQRFQRGEDVETQGSGLGLSIVKQIADLHNASVTLLDAANGRGLRVEVSFLS